MPSQETSKQLHQRASQGQAAGRRQQQHQAGLRQHPAPEFLEADTSSISTSPGRLIAARVPHGAPGSRAVGEARDGSGRGRESSLMC